MSSSVNNRTANSDKGVKMDPVQRRIQQKKAEVAAKKATTTMKETEVTTTKAKATTTKTTAAKEEKVTTVKATMTTEKVQVTGELTKVYPVAEVFSEIEVDTWRTWKSGEGATAQVTMTRKDNGKKLWVKCMTKDGGESIGVFTGTNYDPKTKKSTTCENKNIMVSGSRGFRGLTGRDFWARHDSIVELAKHLVRTVNA